MKPGLDGFGISIVQNDHATELALSGELDLATAPRLRAELLWLIAGGVREVIVDLADLDFIDSTGWSVLVMAMNRLRQEGGDLVLQSPQPGTLRVFELTGLTKVFSISS